MATELCGICGETMPFSMAVHVMLHTGEEGVSDHYVCLDCYEADVEPLFE